MSSPSDVAVEHTVGPADASGRAPHFTTIHDRAGNRSWSGEGATQDAASTEATRKFIGDRRAREYQPQ